MSRMEDSEKTDDGGRMPRTISDLRPLCRLRLARRHDLVGGAADELGHVIELEREAADAGGGRAPLHDEVADLRSRHLHAHHVPAVPAGTGVEAEDLPAPSRHERVHL